MRNISYTCINFSTKYHNKTLNTFRTVESLGPDMNHIIGYTAFHFKLYILQNNKVLKQNIKDSSVLSSGVGLSTFIL